MFQQAPPTLGNQYEDDRVLRSYLARVLPRTMLSEIETSLIELGRLAGGELYQMQLADRLNEPKLIQWDAWGNRIDAVEVTPLWREAERIAVEYGLIATAYEQRHGSLSRVHQCALAYLFTPSTDIYSCPLAMTDGAARTLLNSGNQALIDRAVPHLIIRNPEEFWTAGQWMTELTGGSDVGLSETRAAHHSSEDTWHLYGNKWFASAITSKIALTLARPEGNPPGGRGLALFYVELRDESGRLRNIQINRLKDKLGTRKVPTAELTLAGTPAQLVKESTDGVRNIAPLLNITRLWNGISAVALMRRGLALATDYARRRFAFGSQLADKPLHRDTLAGLQAEAEAAFHFAFYVAELTGRAEANSTNALPSQVGMSLGEEGAAPQSLKPKNQSPSNPELESSLLRLLTPIMKLTTGKQAVQVLSEVIEAFGGAGYVEDTGLPQLLRDSQVLPIWEGTTNVLSLDTLRALDMRPQASQSAMSAPCDHLATAGVSDQVTTIHNQRSATSSQELTTSSADHVAARVGGFQAQAGMSQGQVGMSQGEEGGLAPSQSASNTPTQLNTGHPPALSLPFQAFKSVVLNCLNEVHSPRLTEPVRIAQLALAHAETWLTQTSADPAALEAGSRRFAVTLGRTMELSLLIKHAQWSQDHEADERATAAARLFANSGIDLLVDHSINDISALLDQAP